MTGHDFRSAFVRLGRAPVFTATSIVTIALSLAVVGALTSFVSGLFFQPQSGIRDPERLVAIRLSWQRQGSPYPQLEHFTALQERAPRSITLAFYAPSIAPVRVADRTTRLLVHAVSANYFDVLGASISMGTGFADSASLPSTAHAVISRRYWRDHLGSDAGIIGRTMAIGPDSGFVVTGVAPERFHGPEGLQQADVWIVARPAGTWTQSRMFGRLSGARPLEESRAAVAAELSALWPGVIDALPERRQREWRGSRVVVLPNAGAIDPGNRRVITMLLGGAGTIALLTLLIAGANVASLTLTRAVGRARIFSIKRALGAHPMDLIREPALEVLLLFAGASIAALLLARPIGAAMIRSLHLPVPFDARVTWDMPTVALTIGLGAVVAMLSAVIPALYVAWSDPGATLRSAGAGVTAGAGTNRLQSAFLSVQVFVAFLLITVSGMVALRNASLVLRDIGVPSPETLLVSHVPNTSPLERSRGTETVVRGLGELIGEERVATAYAAPGGENGLLRIPFRRADDPSATLDARVNIVSATFPRVTGMQLMRGRLFGLTDARGSEPVVLMSRAAASRWPAGVDALGARIRVGDGRPWVATVVGIVEDVRYDADMESEPVMYLVADQYDAVLGSERLLVRTDGVAVGARVVDSVLASAFPAAPRLPTHTLASIFKAQNAGPRALLAIVLATAATGVLIAFVGVFGLVAFRVQLHRREIGIRLALGAPVRRIVQRYMMSALRVTALGVAPALSIVWLAQGALLPALGPVAESVVTAMGLTAVSLLALSVLAAAVALLRVADFDPAAVVQ